MGGCHDSITDQMNKLINSKSLTTKTRTILPVPVSSSSPAIYPYEISKFSELGYGVWQYGPGLGFDKRLDIMPADYTGISVTKSARLMNFLP